MSLKQRRLAAIKQFCNDFSRYISGDLWPVVLCRGAILLWLGIMILLKPAFSLRLCAGAGVLLSLFLIPVLFDLLKNPWCHGAWLLAVIPGVLLIFPRNPDMAGVYFAVLVCFITGFKSRKKNGLPFRIMAVTALAAGVILGIKCFTAQWFELAPAAALTFFAAAAWESGNLRSPR